MVKAMLLDPNLPLPTSTIAIVATALQPDEHLRYSMLVAVVTAAFVGVTVAIRHSVCRRR